jgi:hypothetical protein
MRTFQRLAVALTAAGLLTVSAAAAASAAPAHQVTARQAAAAAVPLRGGQTAVTTAPGIAAALLGHGIVPIATLPGTEGARTSPSVTVRFVFPVTGGSVSLKPLAGRILHRGGILFLNVTNGKKIALSNFTINLGTRVLTGIVNGNPNARVPVFTLGLAHATLKVHKHVVSARGVVLRLTKTAAGALDATFGTTLFKAGMVIGTAATDLAV